jgi:membrane protease subunit HflK
MSQQGFGDQVQLPQLPRLPGNAFRGIFLLVLALVLVFTSFYTVGPEETGIVLRFGKYVRSTDPGLHFKLPLFIESVTKVPIQRQV